MPSGVEALVDSDGCGQRRRVRRPIHAKLPMAGGVAHVGYICERGVTRKDYSLPG